MSAALRLALAVVLTSLMPWRAVRKLRRSEAAFLCLCDVLVVQGERLERYEPRPRHLRLVK